MAQTQTAPLLMSDHQTSQLLLQEATGRVKWLGGKGSQGQVVHLTLCPSHLLINASSTLPRGDGNYSTFGDDGGAQGGAQLGGNDNIFMISFADVIGARVQQGSSNLQVFLYAKQEPCCSCLGGGAKGLRSASHLKFSFPSEADAAVWVTYILYLLRDALPPVVGSPTTATAATAAAPQPPKPKKYLVFVNPVSGKGQGQGVWASVEAMFSHEASLELAVVTTTHANHARSHLSTLSLAELMSLDCIVIVGGDGLVFEVVNGITSRQGLDAGVADVLRKVALAHIGAGTGNGLCKSALFECGEEYSATNAAFVALRGRPRAMDLSRVETPSSTNFSFLILGWGLISDIDLLSESLRCMGEARLHAAAVYFILQRRMYRGKLSMHVRHRAGTVVSNGDLDRSSGSDSDSCGLVYTLPPLNQALPIDSAFVSVSIDLESPTTQSSGPSSAGGGDSAIAALSPASNNGNGNGNGSGGNSAGRKNSWQGPGGDAFSWKVIESEFLLVWVLQTSHATVSMHSGPGVRLDDGLFTIFVVEAMTRCEMLQLLLAMDTGDHIHHPRVQCFKANAYRLEPQTPKGLFSLDGENVEYGPLQATVIPGMARVMKL